MQRDYTVSERITCDRDGTKCEACLAEMRQDETAFTLKYTALDGKVFVTAPVCVGCSEALTGLKLIQ